MTPVLNTLARIYRLGVAALSLPIVLAEFFDPRTGADYDVGTVDKLVLAVRMVRNNRRIPTGSSFVEHLVIATRILQVPADVDGGVVECGCYKGGSTANLSLVAGLCDRRLDVFDSFEGMPAPSSDDERHTLVDTEEVHVYEEGSWAASLEEARANVRRYGDGSVVRFHPGYFEETLPRLDDPVVAAFLDVGLRESAETCLEQLWPAMVDGSYCFTHEAKHVEIVALFFDAEWWREHLDREPPGLIGAGTGLGLHPGSNGFSSLLGYAVKNPERAAFDVVSETGEEGNCVDVGVASDD